MNVNRKKRASQQDDLDDEAEIDAPIDVLENTRGRTPRDHVSDEAVGREIERRYFFYIFITL